jgi:hypothetical protein
MFTFTRNWFLGFAAAGALALTVASVPAIADELSLNLGAVGPNEPILKTVGSKRVIALYETDGSHCNMTIAVWDLTDSSGRSAARVWVTLDPRQVVRIGSIAGRRSLDLQCGDNAKSLAIVDTKKVIAGAAQ